MTCNQNQISDLEPLRAFTNLQYLLCGNNPISDLEPQRITLAPELYAQVEKEAQVRGISSETLVHLGLMEWLTSHHQHHICEA